jgi:Rieske Fe-S protein
MDLLRAVLRVSVGLCVALLTVVLAWSATRDGDKPTAPHVVTDNAGTALAIPRLVGVQAALWDHRPVLVFVTTAQELSGVDAARGPDAATPSIGVPGSSDLRLFVLSARSTHLGCTVRWNAGLGASKDIADYDGDGVNDGRVLDPCHLGQWDAFHRGEPQPGTPAPTRLAVLDVRFVDGQLVGTGFDGDVGPQSRG